jgi:hypothetical protein
MKSIVFGILNLLTVSCFDSKSGSGKRDACTTIECISASAFMLER